MYLAYAARPKVRDRHNFNPAWPRLRAAEPQPPWPWQLVRDAASGAAYLRNAVTGATTWSESAQQTPHARAEEAVVDGHEETAALLPARVQRERA